MTFDITAATRAYRHQLIDLFATLTPQQWATQSLCEDWTVKDVAGHLVVAMQGDMVPVTKALVRARGNFDKAMSTMACEKAQADVPVLLTQLRAMADRVKPPPVLGPMSPLADIVLHTQDVRYPLGMVEPIPVDHATAIAEFLLSGKGRFFGVPAAVRRQPFRATDCAWTWPGDGQQELIEGSIQSLLLQISGRTVPAT